MSLALPKVQVTIDGNNIDVGDIAFLGLDLGCTKEFSSFDVLLFNNDKKYSEGANLIEHGDSILIYVGRDPNCPQLLTGSVERLEYEDDPALCYLWLRGRCKGKNIFDRHFTGVYENKKGEYIVKDLIDNYTSLSHTRDAVELIEDTDTTYVRLEYEDTPVWDILRYIAGSASKTGVIGFEMRIEYDGKFAFFPKETKTSPISLADLIEKARYLIDGERIRDWIKVRGAAEKPNDATKDFGTDMATPYKGSTVDQESASGQKNLFVADTAPFSADDKIFIFYYPKLEENEVDSIDPGVKIVCKNNLANTYPIATGVIVYPGWGPMTADTTIAADAANYIVGSRSIKASRPAGPQIQAFYKPAEHMSLNEFPSVNWLWRVSKEITSNITLIDGSWKRAIYQTPQQPGDSKFHFLSYEAGSKKEVGWEIDSGFDWANIWVIMFESNDGNMDFWVDGLFLDHKRWEYVHSNPYDPANPRELIEIIEEFHSDNACELHAKALMAYYRPEMKLVTIDSDVLDWSTNHPMAADKLNVVLPNENLDADFRIDTLEINVIPDMVLDVRINAGKAPPLLADFMFETRRGLGLLMRGQLIK